jgi:hypothetical protein
MMPGDEVQDATFALDGQTVGVRRDFEAVDPDVAASQIQPLGRYVSDALAPRRFSLWLMAAFAIAARNRHGSGDIGPDCRSGCCLVGPGLRPAGGPDCQTGDGAARR